MSTAKREQRIKALKWALGSPYERDADDSADQHAATLGEILEEMDATPAPDRDAVRALKAVYDAAEALLKEAREGCVTELEFQAILKPSGKALQTAVIDARMQALTPSHPSAGRDEVREALEQELTLWRKMAACLLKRDKHKNSDGDRFMELCDQIEALATPQGKESAR